MFETTNQLQSTMAMTFCLADSAGADAERVSHQPLAKAKTSQTFETWIHVKQPKPSMYIFTFSFSPNSLRSF